MSEAPERRLCEYQLAKPPAAMSPQYLIVAPPASDTIPSIFSRLKGAFSSKDNSIVVLQRRGVVIHGVHNAIWERWSDFPLLVTILTIFRSTGSRRVKITHSGRRPHTRAVATLVNLQQAGSRIEVSGMPRLLLALSLLTISFAGQPNDLRRPTPAVG